MVAGNSHGADGEKAVLWLGAMLASLPMLIAMFRKLRALGMLLSEMSVSRAAGGSNTDALRSIVATTIVAAGSITLVLVVLLLSSTVLPSWKLLLVQALLVTVTAMLLRRSFIRLYSRAQFALQETLSQPPAPRHEPVATATIPAVLRDARLSTTMVAPQSRATGRLIGELRLRTQTGASIVGIQREGENIVNPGPDEELRPGDEVLLLGSEKQLQAATDTPRPWVGCARSGSIVCSRWIAGLVVFDERPPKFGETPFSNRRAGPRHQVEIEVQIVQRD